MEFTDAHEEALIHSAWHAITDEETSTPYLFKFACDLEEQTCCFVLTDTKQVWAEALTSRHIFRRGQRVELTREGHDEEDIPALLRRLVELHSFAVADALEYHFRQSENADLNLSLSYEENVWQWDLDLLPRKQGAAFLSKQLIMPMLNWSGYMMDSYMDAITTDHELRQLERALDASGRTAKRHPDKMVESLIRQPLFTTALRRLTEAGSGSARKSAIFREPAEEPQPEAGPSRPSRSDRSGRGTQDRLTSVKIETPPPKQEPSASPAPPRRSAAPSAQSSSRHPVKKEEPVEEEEEEEEREEQKHVASETETEPEEDGDGADAEEEEEEEEEAKPAKEEEDEEEEEEPHLSGRRGRHIKREPKEEEDEEDASDDPPAKSTRGARRKPLKAEPSSSPSPPPRSRKRRRQSPAEDDDVDMDARTMKKEESEEEKPEVKPIFIPKSRVHVKRSKY